MSTNGASIPDYLNEEFFQGALNDGFKRNDVKVKSLNIKLISEGGENYCSDIYRVKVRYSTSGKKNHDISLIVKNMKKNYTDGLPLPSKEIDMYKLVLPKMEEILGKGAILGPKCFKATLDYDEIYLFEDLNALGYSLGERLNGLDEAHAHVLLEKIAIFHAASMVVAEKHPDLIEIVGKSFFEAGLAKIPLVANMVYGNLDYVVELIKDWEGFDEIAVKLQKLSDKYDEKLIYAQESEKIRFKVLNHGDLWVNNFLFKYDNNTPIDVKFIDLQLCTYTSPGYDLHYFFTTSVPLDVAITKRYELLRSYYKSLKNTLKRLEYSTIPTWDDLLNELRETEFLSFQASLLALPMICLRKDVSKGNDLNTLKDVDVLKQQRIHMYESERVLKVTRYTLDRLNDYGVLD